MLIVSYDIENDKLRGRFSRQLTKSGAIRLQYSVYEINNTKRLIENLKLMVEKDFAPKFGGGDSVIFFDIGTAEVIKYGNSIHRDQDIVFF
ncbi:MAG: CRISPR-associated endonuclease Cas2 [Bacteroidales bacterium]|nr:CRISPR-associated endonuclease Cas2 [Bacteroidales bacterium]